MIKLFLPSYFAQIYKNIKTKYNSNINDNIIFIYVFVY